MIKSARAPSPHGDRQEAIVPWGWTDALHGIGLVMGGGLVTVAVLGRFRGPADDGLLTTVAIVLLIGLLLAAVWLFGVNRYGAPWKSVGLVSPLGRWNLLLPLVSLTLSIGFFSLYVALVTAVGPEKLLPNGIEADDLGQGIFRLVNITMIGFVGPLAEEVFFRGFLLAALVPPLGAFRAAALASAVFALSHVDVGVMVPFFATGLLLSWLYLRTRSVWPPFVAHSAQNVLALIGILTVT